MIFSYIINANNATYNDGDVLRVDFAEDFRSFKSIESVDFTFSSAPTSTIFHDIFIRWSYDVLSVGKAVGKPNVVWSAWEPIVIESGNVSDITSLFQRIIKEDVIPFDIQFKCIRRSSASGIRTLDKVEINFTPSIVEISSTSDVPSCSTAHCTNTSSLSSGILINSSENLFTPYNLTDPAKKLYFDMCCAVSEMFGHCVRYFKTTPRVDSADTILKEYSLFDISDVKDIKILIPDNELPDNAIKYIPYDMDFGDSFEIHIVKSQFQLAFGQDSLPEEKDFLYFPLMDRTYEVHSAYSLKDFMGVEAYYKVSLFKWQDKQNVLRTDQIDSYLDDLHVNLEEILQPKTSEEYTNVTKPQQNATNIIGNSDYTRATINPKLQIIKEDIKNYYTIIAQDYYDLKTRLGLNEIALNYKLLANQGIVDNRSFTMWFKTKHTLKDTNEYDTLLSGYDYDTLNGHLIRLKYDMGNISAIEMYLNSTLYTFDTLPLLTQKWYFMTLNVMNEFGQISLHIYEMSDAALKTTNLTLLYSKTLTLVPIIVGGPTYKLISGTFNLTNIRIWSQSIEEEKHSIIANQYLVKDSHLALLIDNAVKPLNVGRQSMK